MSVLSWIVFGALAGWAASVIVGNSRRQGCLTNVVVGIIGAFIGGVIVQFLGAGEFSFAFDWPSFGVAVLGASALLLITGAGNRGKKKRRFRRRECWSNSLRGPLWRMLMRS